MKISTKLTRIIYREFRRVVSILSSAVYLYASTPAFAQSGPPPVPTADPAKKQFGFYHELELDMEVKVQSGNIRIYRSWQGDKKQWSINPQHEPLTLSEETEGEAYGHALAKEISRGPRNFSGGNGLFLASGGGGGEGGGEPSPQVAGMILSNGISYCTNAGEQQIERMHISPNGVKYVQGIGRNWAQFGFDGLLSAWGMGNYRIGQTLYDGNSKPSGYADTFDNQVVTMSRDAQGRIETITDSDGNSVHYSYNTEGLIEDVIDADGVTTHYEYQNGNITLKKIGDASSAPPGEESSEGTTLIYTYYSADGELSSIKTQDNTQVNLQYEYNPDNKLYITTRFESGNRTSRTTTTGKDGVISVERNGEYQIRIEHLCEDTAIIDKNNRITYVDRNELGVIRQVIFPDGRKMLFEHTLANWPEVGKPWNGESAPWGLIKVTFPSGRYIDYERNEHGLVTFAIDHNTDGIVRYYSFKYDAGGNQIEQRVQVGPTANDELDYIKKSVYDLRGQVISYQIGNTGPQWHYEYNGRGQVTKVTAPDGNSWHYVYSSGGRLVSTTDPIGFKQEFEYSKRGLLRTYRETYAVGQQAVTKYFYNNRGLLTKVKDPLDQIWQYEYDGAGELAVITDPQGKKLIFTSDARGRIKSETDGNGVAINYTYYDTAPVGQAPQTSFAFAPRVHVKALSYTREMQYDLADRLLIDIMRPDNGAAQQISYEYDQDSRITGMVRPDGKKIQYTYDQLSRITSITEPGQGTTTLEFPNNLRELKYHDAIGGTTNYSFDSQGRMTAETRVDGNKTSYTYDQNGSLSTVTGALGESAKLIYDPAQRIVRAEVYAAGNSTPVRAIDYTRNLRGDLISAVDGEIINSYTRDVLGRVLSATTSYNSTISKTHSYTYSASGLPATYTTIDGITYSYLWDAANQFQGLIIPNEGSITLSYDTANGPQPTQILFPGGSKQSIEYSDLRQIKHIQSQDPGGATILDRNYSFIDGSEYGPAISSITTEYGAINYSYDDAFRLTDAVGPGGEEHYAYDNIGRRQPAAGPQWSYNPLGAVTDTGEAQYTYDADGNRSTKTDSSGTTKYIYDEASRLVRVEKPAGTVVVEYGYDSAGRRLWKQIGGVKTFYYYDENGLAAELDAAGNVTKSYIFGPGSAWSTAPFAIRDGGTYHYVHGDHLGTPQKLIKKNGQVTWEGRYDAFGNVEVLNATVTNPFRFPGQYADEETGLYHNFQRNYDPNLGAYAESDPFGVLTTGPNRYAYAGSNPVMGFDEMGLLSWGAKVAIAGGIVVATVGIAVAAVVFVPAAIAAPIVLGVLFAAQLAATAYDGSECYKWARDPCLHPGGGINCLFAAVDAAGLFLVVRAAWVAVRGFVSLSPEAIRFSQSSVNGVKELTASMKANGWRGPPIDVVRMSDGTLTTFDNSRLLAAQRAGIDVRAIVRESDAAFPAGRWTPRSGTNPGTWGEAVQSRIQQQNRQFREQYPNGSNFTGSSQ